MDNFKRERMERFLQQSDFDAVVASSYENVYYLSGASIITQRQIPDRLELVVWKRGAEPIMLVCNIEANLASTQSWIADQRSYVEFKTSPIELLADTLRELHLERGRIGIETHHLTMHFSDELEHLLPNAHFASGDTFFNRIRMVKSEQEIAILARAAHQTDEAMYCAWDQFTLGMTEKDLANKMQTNLMERGADSLAFLVLGAADAARMAHPSARDRKMVEGDLIRVDFAGFFDGYHSDLARTGIVGKRSEHAADIYNRLWQVHEEMISVCRPGMPANSLFYTCRDAFAKLGLFFNMPHVGHGLGIGLHEHPILEPQNETPLEVGMALALEPIHSEPDETRFHVEDLVIIRENGPEVVSRSHNWDELFVLA